MILSRRAFSLTRLRWKLISRRHWWHRDGVFRMFFGSWQRCCDLLDFLPHTARLSFLDHRLEVATSFLILAHGREATRCVACAKCLGVFLWYRELYRALDVGKRLFYVFDKLLHFLFGGFSAPLFGFVDARLGSFLNHSFWVADLQVLRHKAEQICV